MLDSTFSFETPTEVDDKRQPYNLILRKCSSWDSMGRRVLIVAQTVDSRDLAAGEMMGDKATQAPLINAIRYARKIAKPYLKEGQQLPSAAYAVVNFNNEKHLHLSKMKRRESEALFARRLRSLIRKLKPTHVLMSGDEAMRACFPKIDLPQYKRGWVHNVKMKDHSMKVVSTLDFYRLLEKDGAHANLLGFWCRHFANLLLGRNPHDLSHVKAKPRYVKTREQFDRLMERLYDAGRVSVDTETKNLSVLHNSIYTIQFCTDHNESVGYVLALDHPLAHWTKEDRLYMKKELRRFFSAKEGPLLITFNGMYDLRVIRQCLKIPIIWHRVWEITFGEHALDENYTQLNGVTFMTANGKKSTFGGLAPIYCSYGNSHYFGAAFGKEDRNTAGTIKPTDVNFLEYAATDVVALMGIYHQQISRAAHTEIAGMNFKPYFVRHMLHQMSDTAHQLSHLRQDGSKVDRKYLKSLLSAESPLNTELRKAEGALRVHREVRQANSELLKESGFKAGSLFAHKKTETATAARWMFSFTKTLHKRKLFFDILQLEAVTQTKTGEDAIDKKFIAHHKDRNKVVSLYGEFQGLTKLKSTYVKGWYKKMSTNMDAATNDHLCPDYYVIDTGRLASRGPSLQQIPARGRLSKLIKRMFVASPGYLMIRYDYSAHEVRVWSIASGDKVLAAAFKAGQKLRQEFIKDPSEANKKAIKEKGDIHILNVLRFFGKLVDKDHPLRDAVKKVVFGVLYGKGAETLGIDTKEGDLTNLKTQISALYEESLVTTDKKRLAEINEKLEELDHKLTALMDEDRTDYAQGIMDKMFSEFKAGARWTERMQSLAEKEYQVYSPIGRVRHLYAAMTEDRKIVARQVRRGSNAPIQGYASEIGVKAGRITLEHYYKNLKIFKKMLGITKSDWDLRVFFSRMIHDANYFMVPYEMVVPFIHIMQYQATYGIAEAYKAEFNTEFTVEPEIEIEVAARDDASYKWDWAMPSIVDILKKSIKDADELGVLEGTPEDVERAMLKPWRMPKFRSLLQEQWPLLGVKDLDTQIKDSVKRKNEELLDA